MVCSADWQGRQVAVKSLRITNAFQATCFMREAQTLMTVQHQNVVRLLGVHAFLPAFQLPLVFAVICTEGHDECCGLR